MRTILIAIGGASCSGKTTLAKQLAQLLPGILIHQDDFALPSSEVPIHPKYGVQDWDDPETCIDWVRFRDTLAYLKEKGTLPPGYASYDHLNDKDEQHDRPIAAVDALAAEYRDKFPPARYVLVDGFVLFWDEEVRRLMDVEVMLRVSRDTLKRRREDRSYALLHAEDAIDGKVWTDPPGYFDNIVYPAYIKAHEGLFEDGVDSAIKDEHVTLIEPKEGDEGITRALEEACEAILAKVA